MGLTSEGLSEILSRESEMRVQSSQLGKNMLLRKATRGRWGREHGQDEAREVVRGRPSRAMQAL